jgi:hypothetical protein
MPPSSDPWRHSRRRRDRFRDRIFTNDQGKGRHAEVAQAAHGLAHARTRHAGGRAVRRSNDCTRWCGGALRPFAGSAGRESTIFDGFNSVDSLASTARGSEARVPTLNQVVQDLSASAKGKGGKSFGAAVPVYFHVGHADGVGNISQRIIDEQMRVSTPRTGGSTVARQRDSRSSSSASRERTTRRGTSPDLPRVRSAR